jgi:hypothetical protein
LIRHQNLPLPFVAILPQKKMLLSSLDKKTVPTPRELFSLDVHLSHDDGVEEKPPVRIIIARTPPFQAGFFIDPVITGYLLKICGDEISSVQMVALLQLGAFRPHPLLLGFLCKCWRLTDEGGIAKITSAFILSNYGKMST